MNLSLLPTALGCGIVAGVFFAFSSFVMKALEKLPAQHGIAAMQSINHVVLNPLFLGVFLGTAILCLATAIVQLLETPSPRVVAACAIYLVGTFAVTVLGNVPLNNRLAAFDPSTPVAATFWSEYLIRWTFWNHVRTIASLVSCGLLFLR